MYTQVLVVHATMTSSLLTGTRGESKVNVYTIHYWFSAVWTICLTNMTKQHKVHTSLRKAWAERFQSTKGSCVPGYLTSLLYGDGTW